MAFEHEDMTTAEELAEIDRELARLVARRLEIARRLGRAAPAEARQARPEAVGLPEGLYPAILSRIAREAVKTGPTEKFPATVSEPRPVVIIGGNGGMGRGLRSHFERSGWPVRVLDRSDWPRAAEILEGAGTVIVSVPIDVTEATIARLKGLMPADAVLADVTSVKTEPLHAMLKAHAGPVVGLHPMFGPDVGSYAGQVFVICPGRDDAACEPLVKQIALWGARLCECTAEQHDRAMSIIQALRHFTTYAYGAFLAKIHPDLAKIVELSSPIYRLELDMVGRLFAQDPHLYADIILASPRNTELIREYVESLWNELIVISGRDRNEFIRRFLDVREFFGDFAQACLRDSGAMLRAIQEEREARK
ncbi:bifunctional chorismate mutase/prephenate dehydrogenase [Sutterella sp.]|uniref:bifunctional chorismate mutase/prephenate dehydrogenase n=1 Tax=Sutterella sp. TaxID=1981025 RepID=UPI0026E07B76|nr:bifunctional chorismate mutase/prephenate dehydrogenase [Sutterella sp.]MDO5530555.1 bifunctional chorismate mutase/prephenate dehydrogenase [Sutterella sp.]